MIRLMIRTDNGEMAAHLGGSVLTTIRTFDVYLPEVEAALGGGRSESAYSHAQVIGAEIILPAQESEQP